MADFNHANHGHLYALMFKGLKRLDAEVGVIGNEDIGTEEREIGPLNIVLQADDFAIPLVVAHRREVKARSVHQLDHGIIDGVVLVVDGIARAVVACRKHQQVRIDIPQTVDQRSKLGEHVDVGVHVVDGEDGDFSCTLNRLAFNGFILVFWLMAKGEKQNHRQQGEHQ